VVLICTSLMANDFENLLMSLPSVYSLHWNSVHIFCSCSNWIFFAVEFWELFIYSRYQSFVVYVDCKYVLPFYSGRTCFFTLLTGYFIKQKFLILVKSNLYFYCMYVISFSALSKNFSARPESPNFFLTFF
jgi:hypothetical protein